MNCALLGLGLRLETAGRCFSSHRRAELSRDFESVDPTAVVRQRAQESTEPWRSRGSGAAAASPVFPATGLSPVLPTPPSHVANKETLSSRVCVRAPSLAGYSLNGHI